MNLEKKQMTQFQEFNEKRFTNEGAMLCARRVLGGAMDTK